MDELATHRRRRQFPQCLALVALGCAHGNLLDLVDGHGRRPPQAFDDGLGAHALLDELFDFLEYFARYDHDAGRPVADLCILRPRNVRQYPCRGVDDVEKFHDGRAVVGDGLSAVAVDKEEVAAIGAQGGLHRVLHREAGIDV